MELTDRFFGNGTPELGGPPVANLRLADPPAFALLFATMPMLDADALTLALRNYHPELAQATAELLAVMPRAEVTDSPPGIMGLIGWGRHVVKVVGFASPMPASAVERCVSPAHYDPETKEAATQHQAYVLLFYAGYEPDPYEQHVALAAAAAALTRFDAIVVLNETAVTSVPAIVLLPHEEDEGDTLKSLRTLPLPFLFAGFVKLEVEGDSGIWMRTHGCRAFGLPDLAFHAASHEQGTATFNLFANLLAYMRESNQPFVPGDTMNIGDGLFLRVREHTEAEWFLDAEHPILVTETISEAETNP